MNNHLIPEDLSDAGNSKVFATEYTNRFLYSKHDGWLYWDGKAWVYGEMAVIAAAKDLTERIELEAQLLFAVNSNDPEIKALVKHARASRNKGRLMALIDLAKPELFIESDKLDAHPHLLNTPDGIVDLRTGIVHPHEPTAYCTKITKFGPTLNANSMAMWLDFLNMIACGDSDLVEFLQEFSGMVLIGKVYSENLIIAYGTGANGKSTFFNALAAVLGHYAGLIAADTLMSGRNKGRFELSTMKNKRFLLASELEEGRVLSSSVLKQLTSTDEILVEKKYFDPENIVPKHTIVLFTNHLPKIASTDHGTLRRLIAVPFNAVIPDSQKIMNFTDILVGSAGSAIMSWAIEGAVKFVANEHKLHIPACVQNATAHYHADNDWLKDFLDDLCLIDPSYSIRAGELYDAYKSRTEKSKEFVRDGRGFAKELQSRGFVSKRTNRGNVWLGLSLTTHIRAMQLSAPQTNGHISHTPLTSGDGNYISPLSTESEGATS